MKGQCWYEKDLIKKSSVIVLVDERERERDSYITRVQDSSKRTNIFVSRKCFQIWTTLVNLRFVP